MPRIDLEQGTTEWLAWRKGGIGGSDVSCIMGTNPWRSAYDLWLEKTGRDSGPEFNAAMRRGVQLEPEAREAFYDKTGIWMVPACYEHDLYPECRSSLDGIDLSGDVIQEIKCPSSWAVHQRVLEGSVPIYYYQQCQYNMAVSRAKICQFVSYYPEAQNPEERLAIIKIERNADDITELLDQVCYFWELVLNDTPPEITEVDYVRNEEPSALVKAEAYLLTLLEYKRLEKELERAKKELLEETDDGNCLIGPLRLTRVVRKGCVDYDKAFQDLGLDKEAFEQYRKKDSLYWKITEVKE